MRLLLLGLGILAASPVLAANKPDSDTGFYQQRERGWYWHEIFPEDIEPEPEPPKPEMPAPAPVKMDENPESSKSKLEPMTVKWFQENLPKSKEMALNPNSAADVQRYVYIQRAAIDRANQFATTYISQTMFDPFLDEGLRRPEADISVGIHKTDQDRRHWKLIDKIGKEAALIYFYSSTCPYCAKQTASIIRMAKEHGWKVMPVSLDGGPVPNDDFEELGPYRVATKEMAQKFDVVATPTLYLSNKKGDFFVLANGLVSMDNIGERIVLTAKREGMISLAEYNNQTQVKELYMTSADMEVDTDKVYDDPDYLVKKMRGHMKKVSGGDFDNKLEGAKK